MGQLYQKNFDAVYDAGVSLDRLEGSGFVRQNDHYKGMQLLQFLRAEVDEKKRTLFAKLPIIIG